MTAPTEDILIDENGVEIMTDGDNITIPPHLVSDQVKINQRRDGLCEVTLTLITGGTIHRA